MQHSEEHRPLGRVECDLSSARGRFLEGDGSPGPQAPAALQGLGELGRARGRRVPGALWRKSCLMAAFPLSLGSGSPTGRCPCAFLTHLGIQIKIIFFWALPKASRLANSRHSGPSPPCPEPLPTSCPSTCAVFGRAHLGACGAGLHKELLCSARAPALSLEHRTQALKGLAPAHRTSTWGRA